MHAITLPPPLPSSSSWHAREKQPFEDRRVGGVRALPQVDKRRGRLSLQRHLDDTA